MQCIVSVIVSTVQMFIGCNHVLYLLLAQWLKQASREHDDALSMI